MIPCPDCNGRGSIDDHDELGPITVPCDSCRGDCEVEGDDDGRADRRARDREIAAGLRGQP